MKTVLMLLLLTVLPGCLGTTYYERNAVNMRCWDFERIIIDIDRVPLEDLQRAVAHELGHHFVGPGHLSDPAALMWPAAGSVTPTAADKQALVLSRLP